MIKELHIYAAFLANLLLLIALVVSVVKMEIKTAIMQKELEKISELPEKISALERAVDRITSFLTKTP